MPATALGALGALGTGVTGFDGADAGPVPTLLVAVTVNVYAVLLVRPGTVHVNGPLDHEHVAPPGDAVTV